MNDRDRIRLTHAQEQDAAAIRDQWQATDTKTQSELLDWLESNEEAAKHDVANWPLEWVDFVQRLAIVGLKQSIFPD